MKEYHHGNLHQALISSTLTLLKTKNPEELSLRQVARQAGVSHSALYRHFADKAALLTAVAQSVLSEFNEYLEDSITQTEANPIERLQIISMAYICYALEHKTKYQLLFGNEALEDLNLFPKRDLSLDNSPKINSNKMFQNLVEIIEMGQAAGEFKVGNVKIMALGIWASLHGLAMLLLQGEFRLEDIETLTLVSLLTSNIADNIPGIQD